MPSENGSKQTLAGSYTIPFELAQELRREHKQEDSILSKELQKDIVSNEYQQRRYQRAEQLDFSKSLSYKETMERRELEREEQRVRALVEEKKQQTIGASTSTSTSTRTRTRKRRWDVTPEEYQTDTGELHISESNKKVKSVIGELLHSNTKVAVVGGIPLTDSILDKILPSGYVKVNPPVGYTEKYESIPDLTEASIDMYIPPSETSDYKSAIALGNQLPTDIPGVKGLQFFKEQDMKYFGKLIHVTEPKSKEERKEINVMKLILKVKNGSQIARKRSLRQLTDNSRKYGADILLGQILPLLVEPSLEQSERHILVKLVGRILFQLDELVRPHTNKILIVIAPLLIDEDFTLRLEAREIISNLTKAAGMANMISNIRPDIDHTDEFVRNISSRVCAIVANTLGLSAFLPFLKAVIKSKKNWMARHTGIKIIQQLCIILGEGNGNSILPYLSQLVEILKPTLMDEILSVRIITALTLTQLAENVKPFGIESFETILEPAWIGLKRHRGKSLAAFLKCIGSIIPLMQYDNTYEEYSNYYTKEIVIVMVREFNSPDDDMRKTILKILSSLPLSRKLIPNYNKEIIQPFFKSFWNRRTASDIKQISKLVVDATNELAIRFNFLDVLQHVVYYSKDDNEQLRRLAVQAIYKLTSSNPDELLALDSHLETNLVDGILYAFQEQTIHQRIYLQAFGAVAKALNIRLSPHMNSIISTILYRLKNESAEIRQQAADLITILASTINQCSEPDNGIIPKLILILYESLGEVYPDVLGSIINALFACIDTQNKSNLYAMQNPSVNQILPSLTPILKNRQEKVQEASIKLVGLIANKSPETINAKEWMRICFELLEMLKSTKKRIRVAANDTFGHIAKTVGPQDVIVMLLNNLRVQERQLRVCTAVAMGIVAETCSPFTVLPAIMNEYRIPEKNVQNGVLKALTFLFEYLDGATAKDYLFAISPLLEDALTDRDLVHRQTAATVIRHIALNCIGLANEEIFIHFLNLVIPNIYETSPHVIIRILESVEAIRLALGNGVFTNYIWAGLFHPAKKVRNPYWKIYNTAYVHNVDALVPYYPKIETLPDTQDINYNIDELDLFL
ncbi:armadillo-type protein [Scheffersomyces amazonensis]|uniref:armadillo-type protein n=1 Tax=Scheffersomyces amazonensis TaxID=1078765 RepID=UPI00315D9E29